MKTWENTYELLKDYYNEFGNSSVPFDEMYQDTHLGYWVAKQRKLFHQKKLSDTKIALLQEIDFVWDVHKDSWNLHYALCQEYKSKYGDIDIPKRYVMKKDGQTYYLGRWIGSQRVAYNGKGSHVITTQQIRKLDKLGMSWSCSGTSINTSFNECAILYYAKQVFPNACKYKKDNVELDVYIPELNLAIEYDGQAWHTNERDLKKNQYCKEQGIQIIRIREVGCDILNDGISLDYYFDTSRIEELEAIIHNILPCCLDIDIERDSDDIFNTYKNALSQSWKDKYALCVDYYKKHKTLDIKFRYETEDGVKLGQWLHEQRKSYRKNRLPSEKVKLLNKIGIVWYINAQKSA